MFALNPCPSSIQLGNQGTRQTQCEAVVCNPNTDQLLTVSLMDCAAPPSPAPTIRPCSSLNWPKARRPPTNPGPQWRGRAGHSRRRPGRGQRRGQRSGRRPGHRQSPPAALGWPPPANAADACADVGITLVSLLGCSKPWVRTKQFPACQALNRVMAR